MGLTFQTQLGQEISLLQQLASGGEGAIWQTNIPEMVAKIYYKPTAFQKEKLAVMVQSPPHDPTLKQQHVSIAWPYELLLDDEGGFAGFMMPRVSGSLTLNNIYNPKLRKKKAPGFNWYYLFTAAYNIASIIEALHQRGYVIGDVKTENFLVNENALVSITDTDSFQVRDQSKLFRCVVGSEGFTPPELIGKDFHKVNRTETHDRFGLSVLVYMLIMGYHPFSGSWAEGEEPLTKDQAIARCAWPYSDSLKDIQASPLMISLDILPVSLKDAFLQTFNEGYQLPHKRLTAKEWRILLKDAIKSLVVCKKNENHFYEHQLDHCPWCVRAQETGLDVFPPVAGGNRINIHEKFKKALDTKDYRQVSSLWRENAFLQEDTQYYHLRNQMKRIEAELKVIDEFKQKLQVCQEQHELFTALERFPQLKHVNVFHEEVEGVPLQKILHNLSHQKNALATVKQAIDKADSFFTKKQSLIQYERAILEAVQSYTELATIQKPFAEEIQERIETAKQRLAAWHTLEQIMQKKIKGDLIAVWEAHFELVKGFQLPTDVSRHIEVDRTHERTFQRFERFLKENPYDDEALLRFWENEKTFQRSRYPQKKVLKNKSLQQLINEASERCRILRAIELAAPQKQYKTAATLWKASICQNHPVFKPYQAFIEESLKVAQQWQKVKRSLLENENETVLHLWDEHMTPFARDAQLNEKVQAVFRHQIPFEVHLPQQAAAQAIRHRDFLEVTFPWPTLTLSRARKTFPAPYVVLLFHQDFFPKKEKDVVSPLHRLVVPYEEGQVGGSVLVPSVSALPYLSLFAAQHIAGQLLTVGDPWLIRMKQPPQVSYQIKPRKRFFSQKAGCQITIEASEEVYMPDMGIWRHEERPLLPDDLVQNQSCGHLKGQMLHKGKTILHMSCDKNLVKGKQYLRLYPLDLSVLNHITFICQEGKGS